MNKNLKILKKSKDIHYIRGYEDAWKDKEEEVLKKIKKLKEGFGEHNEYYVKDFITLIDEIFEEELKKEIKNE